ncbi:MAG TPA: YceI family protein [Edaphobacter sp.]
MLSRPLQALLTVITLSLAPLLHAQQTIAFDPAHSEIHFTLGGNLHAVHGTFALQPSRVEFSPSTSKASGTISVDATSGASGNSSRDRRMTTDILKAPSYKTVTFTPASYTGAFNPTGDSNLTVHGTLTLLGSAHPIDVPMKVHAEASSIQATGSFTIPYTQWGLKDPSTFVFRVDKEVRIDLDLHGSLQP